MMLSATKEQIRFFSTSSATLKEDIKSCSQNERIITLSTMNIFFILFGVILVLSSTSGITSMSSPVKKCAVNKDCTTSEICYRTGCINICAMADHMRQWPGCAYNAHCAMIADRIAGCECDFGMVGEPYRLGCDFPH